jgi:hypothetical protein
LCANLHANVSAVCCGVCPQTVHKGFISKLLFSQLAIPTVLGNPSLPLILVEDDVVFDPHTGKRLEEV